MIRFIHAADLHLDSPLRGLDESAPAERIRMAPRQALVNLIDWCLEVDADFLLLAGDCYDGDCKDGATGAYLATQLRRLGDKPVIILRGNHDAQSVISNFLPMPRNVIEIKDKAQTVPLPSLNVNIHGTSFQQRCVGENLVLSYPKNEVGTFNIGILHTSLTHRGVHETYAPCTVEQLTQLGYDYWALGHIHTRQVVQEREPAIVFPGNLQGRHARECGAKGAYLVEVDSERCISCLTFRALDAVRWEKIELNVNPALSTEQILSEAASHVSALRNEAGDRLLAIRIVLKGPCLAHEEFQSDPRSWRERLVEHVKNVDEDAWLEDVRFETSTLEEESTDGRSDAEFELTSALKEFLEDPKLLAELIESDLADLADKLPGELKTGAEPVNLRDHSWVREHFVRVLPTLRQRGTS